MSPYLAKNRLLEEGKGGVSGYWVFAYLSDKQALSVR